MSKRHLPETEIANLAFLPTDQKRIRLEAFIKPKRPKGSYDPFRFGYPDAVNLQSPMFPEHKVFSSWEKVRNRVISKCYGDPDLEAMNLAVARATYDFAKIRNLSAEPIEVPGVTMVPGHSYRFGAPLLLRSEDIISVAFSDLRRTNGLSVHGRRVVFSHLHERFRVNFPEFAGIDLEIWRYSNCDSRQIVPIKYRNEPIYEYKALSDDMKETYDILDKILDGYNVNQKNISDLPLFRSA